jgi:hypothetical protein
MYVVSTTGYNSGNLVQRIYSNVKAVRQNCDKDGVPIDATLVIKKNRIVIGISDDNNNGIVFKRLEVFNKLTDKAIGKPIILGKNNEKNTNI